jgi:hypothetical protein
MSFLTSFVQLAISRDKITKQASYELTGHPDRIPHLRSKSVI